MKLLCVASEGGHWEELIRIVGGLSDQITLTYCSTNTDCRFGLKDGVKFYKIEDFNRNSTPKIFNVIIRCFKILKKERPNAVISTGAAPGLAMIVAAKLLGITTIWVDSVANVEGLSLCGRFVQYFVNRIYTQWKHLETDKIIYAGSVIGNL